MTQEILTGADSSCAAWPMRALNTFSAIPAAPCSTSYDFDLQARQISAHPGPPRAGRHPRRRCVFAQRRPKVGVALVTIRPGRDQCRHRHCHAYGFHPDGDHQRAGAHSAIGGTPSRSATPSASRRPIVKHNFLRAGRASDLADDASKKAFYIAPHAAVPARCWSTSPRTCIMRRTHVSDQGGLEMRSYNPVRQGPRRADPQGLATAAGAKRPLHLHAVAASSWRTRAPS